MPNSKPTSTVKIDEMGNSEDIIPDSLASAPETDHDILWEFDAHHSFEIMIADNRWAAYFDDALKKDAHQLVIFASALIENDGFTACLRLTDDAEMHALNAQFRDKDKATNILSFPNDFDQEDGTLLHLGDMAFGFDTIAQESQDMAISLDAHMRHLIIHGLLHLIGFDHEQDEDAAEMEALEIAALSVIGIANPYQGELA